MTNEEFIAAARAEHDETPGVEIHHDAEVDRCSTGAYVQAWVWVYDKSQTRYKE